MPSSFARVGSGKIDELRLNPDFSPAFYYNPAADAGLRSIGRPRRIAEDTPSASLGRKPRSHSQLRRFATKAGEKSGLTGEITPLSPFGVR